MQKEAIMVLDTCSHRNRGIRIELVYIEYLKPHEETIDEHVNELLRDITEKRVLIRPILVDEKTMTILDGHHRVEALRRLGARYVPAILVDYDDDCIGVDTWKPGWRVTKSLVRFAATSGKLLPPRTSKHVTCFRIPELSIPLHILVERGDA
ncbi:MAG: ParB N-terminal domain-containing protein [Desulfurococcales archaeon]|nr:ParB N-terminal domain-containing protein [Desulfurococcales archaeon]